MTPVEMGDLREHQMLQSVAIDDEAQLVHDTVRRLLLGLPISLEDRQEMLRILDAALGTPAPLPSMTWR